MKIKDLTDENVIWHSDFAIAHKIENKPTDPDIYTTIYNCAVDLYNNCLTLLIDQFGELTITSFYRSPELNVALGGSKTSSHMSGQACDFVVEGVVDHEIIEWIIENIPEYDQCIFEHPTGRHWVHISYREGNNRKQNLSYDGHGYTPFTS